MNETTMKIAVILPAAGLGKRFAALSAPSSPDGGGAGGASKIELDLAGRPVFLRALELFYGRPEVTRIILAVNPDSREEFLFRWGDRLRLHGVEVVAGGRKERWETVLKAMEAVPTDCTHIAIHDAARPLGSAKLIDRVFAAAAQHDAVIPAVPVSATLKRTVAVEAPPEPADPLDAILGSTGGTSGDTSGGEGIACRRVTATVDRTDLMEVQTPQVFQADLLRRAYARISSGAVQGAGITDDAGLVEALGQAVMVVDGEVTNLKITRPDDMELAQAIIAWRRGKESATQAAKRLFVDEDE